MKKNTLVILAAIGLASASALAAPRLVPCTMEEQARYGATHSINVLWSDLSASTATNVPWAITNTVTGPLSMKFKGYLLNQPFNDTKTYTNGSTTLTTNSLLIYCGTNVQANGKWINGLQCAYDQGVTVPASFGTDYTVATGATNAAATVTSPWIDSAQSVSLVVTMAIPSTTTNTVPLANMTRGQARFFFQIIGVNWQQQ